MLLFGTLFTLPNATDLWSGVGAYSSPLFIDFTPLIYIILGVSVVFLVIAMLLKLMHH